MSYRKYRYLDTDIHIYTQDNETVRLLQVSSINKLSVMALTDKEIIYPKAIINCSYFDANGGYVLGRNQGDERNDTHDQEGYYDMVILKNNSYILKPMKSWDYQSNPDVVAGFSPAAILIQNSIDVELLSTAIVNTTKITSKNPQTALGYANGKFIFIVSDGRSSSNSGVNGRELRTFIKQTIPSIEMLVLLDGGGSSEMIVNRHIMNIPSDGKERPMFNGLALFSSKEPIKEETAILKFQDYKGIQLMSGITQGQNEGTHKLLNGANDYCGRGSGDRVDLLAPYSCVVKAIADYDNTVFFESLGAVKTPNGSYPKCWFMATHMPDEDKKLLNIHVGREFKQGEPCYTEGHKGIGSGNHIHLEQGEGGFAGGSLPYYKSSDSFEWNGQTYTQYYPNATGYEHPVQNMFFLDPKVDYKDSNYKDYYPNWPMIGSPQPPTPTEEELLITNVEQLIAINNRSVKMIEELTKLVEKLLLLLRT